MDLRSILSDSSNQRAQPPRLTTSTGSHTPQSSYDARVDSIHTPSSDVNSARPTPYTNPSHNSNQDVRVGPPGGGSYFALHSSHPNSSVTPSASTPSAGPPSAYSQSPGNYVGPGAGHYTPRDSHPPSAVHQHNTAFASPSQSSPRMHMPPTPGSAQHAYQAAHQYPPNHGHGHLQSQYHSIPQYQQFQSPPPPQPNGLPRQISPSHQFQGQPATPLGPPINYPKSSPQTHVQRPTSQGGPPDHLRRASQSSIGSALSRDYNHYQAPIPDPPRRDSVSRSYPYSSREREKSMSVSPKTIPRPAPHREHSASSQTMSHERTSTSLHIDSRSNLSQNNSIDHQVEPPHIPSATPGHSITSTPEIQRPPSNDQISCSGLSQPLTERPAMNHQQHQMPAKQEDLQQDQLKQEQRMQNQSLKRSASHLSDTPPNLPPQKRPRNEVPRWAQSARGSRPLNLDFTPHPNKNAKSHQQRANITPQRNNITPAQPTQHHANGGAAIPQPPPDEVAGSLKWETTITNIIPTDNMTKKICDWICMTAGANQPPEGSLFEVEAKIGQIIDQQSGHRLNLSAADSEVLIRQGFPVRFRSAMSQDQHRKYNEFLNHQVMESQKAKHRGEARWAVSYEHPKENDEFFILSEEGEAQLPNDLRDWIERARRSTHRREIRVRRTVKKDTREVIAQVIKTRLADREIYNPDFEFDFRISISLETIWNGDERFLTPARDMHGRNKDRMQYEHRFFHIDLTQVTHDDSSNMEHELEVEVNPPLMETELTKLRNGQSNFFQPMIQDLLNNTRLLARQGGRRQLQQF